MTLQWTKGNAFYCWVLVGTIMLILLVWGRTSDSAFHRCADTGEIPRRTVAEGIWSATWASQRRYEVPRGDLFRLDQSLRSRISRWYETQFLLQVCQSYTVYEYIRLLVITLICVKWQNCMIFLLERLQRHYCWLSLQYKSERPIMSYDTATWSDLRRIEEEGKRQSRSGAPAVPSSQAAQMEAINKLFPPTYGSTCSL